MTMTVLDRAPVSAAAGQVADADQGRPDLEVPERARRRTFTAKYKLDVLVAYDAAEPGEKGAILRRKGLYSSHIVEWRRARDAGALAGLTAPRGQRRPDTRDATIARLTKEKTRLERDLGGRDASPSSPSCPQYAPRPVAGDRRSRSPSSLLPRQRHRPGTGGDRSLGPDTHGQGG